ncbi:winged helix domain-containing protein [Tabrizicola soli]|uniref:Winged helix domain-containing protein n=2 Tax=Tabrizicola soli TaxID=2185115 RepID=A0ABV7DV26_9RHOB
MGRHSTWDRRSWTVTPAEGATFTVATSEGATWALRALIAAGPAGLRPTDGASGRFCLLIGKLRDLGLSIEDLPAEDEGGRAGFRLVCQVDAA